MPSVLRGFPMVGRSGRLEAMEVASDYLWQALKHLSVNQLKALRPTPEYQPLIDALVEVRLLIGDGRPGIMTEHP